MIARNITAKMQAVGAVTTVVLDSDMRGNASITLRQPISASVMQDLNRDLWGAMWSGEEGLLIHRGGEYEDAIDFAFQTAYFDGRSSILNLLPKLKMANPEIVMAQVVAAFPGLDFLEDRYSLEWRDSWREDLPGLQVLKKGRGWDYRDASDEILLGDIALSIIIELEDWEPAFIREFVLRWSLARSHAFMHNPDRAEEAIALLVKSGLNQEADRVRTYLLDW